MRTLVIGDIHGGCKALLQVLERAEVTSQDRLIFLGDYVDGWSESAQTVEKLIALAITNTCTFIRGNHDLWCGLWINKGVRKPVWLAHGGEETIESYVHMELLTDHRHQIFFDKLEDYFIDAENRLFIHAGFTSMNGVKKEEYASNYYFDRTLWEAAMLAENIAPEILAKNPPRRFLHYNEIYIGHTPTTTYQESTPLKAHNVYNVDTGAAFKGKLTIMDIDSKEFWQSDTLPSLYPEEKGRN